MPVEGSVLPRRLLASPGARLMSNAEAAQVAQRRASPALCENKTGKLLVRDNGNIGDIRGVNCGRLEEGKSLCFRVEVEQVEM